MNVSLIARLVISVRDRFVLLSSRALNIGLLDTVDLVLMHSQSLFERSQGLRNHIKLCDDMSQCGSELFRQSLDWISRGYRIGMDRSSSLPELRLLSLRGGRDLLSRGAVHTVTLATGSLGSLRFGGGSSRGVKGGGGSRGSGGSL